MTLIDKPTQILVLKQKRVSIEIEMRKQVEILQLEAAREISLLNLEIESLEGRKKSDCICDEA